MNDKTRERHDSFPLVHSSLICCFKEKYYDCNETS